jgi:hypothetical protein
MAQKSVSTSPAIYINNVKAGMEVHFTDGRIGFVTDNRKGLIRQVRVENGDMGDDYAFNWAFVYIGPNKFNCVLTPAQRKQADKIKAALAAYR